MGYCDREQGRRAYGTYRVALPESMLDDWLDHLDRMFRASFPEVLVSTWREHKIDGAARLWGAAMTFSWAGAEIAIRRLVKQDEARPPHSRRLDDGQRASLSWIARRIQEDGVVLADEVGSGKTRIACAVVHAVLEAGGRAAVVVPHGLMHQWTAESRKLRKDSPVPKSLTTLPGSSARWARRRISGKTSARDRTGLSGG